MADNEDPADLFGDDDLFGDEDDDRSEQERALSDRELDSGDDEDRNDRAAERGDDTAQQIGTHDREARIMDADFARQTVPKPTDGQLHILRIPKFLGLAPKAYDSSTFEIPVTDHHSTTRSANFSASATANTTIRYRKNTETRRLESNAIMSRWSDGSVTITVGDQSYELQGKPLAPPMGPHSKNYQDVLDSHQYLATPYVSSQLLHIVGHMTNQYIVMPNKEIQDDALEKLQSGLAAAARGRNNSGDSKSGLALISSTQDPELQKKQAELAEKERLKLQRRRETAAARADQQAGKVRTGIGGGLTLDDLERGGARNSGLRKKRSAPSGPRRARRKADYDSDDDLPHGRSREDEYDLEDDFLAPSDEEIEGEDGDGDDDSEEEIDEGSEEEKGHEAKKRKTDTASRKNDEDAEGESDIDAEGEIDDGAIPMESAATGDAGAGRGRKRHIIEDDEDE